MVSFIKKFIPLNHPFIINMGWLALAQILGRIFRLLLSIVIARILMPESYGALAIILTVHELVSAVIRRSTQTRIVNAKQQEVDDICVASSRLNWVLSIFAFLLQCLLGVLVANAYNDDALLLPVVALALSHLMLPFAMVQVSLNLRYGRLKIVALCEVLQAIFESLISLILLLLLFDIWSIIISKVVVVTIWIFVHRHYCSWRSTHYKTTEITSIFSHVFSSSNYAIVTDILVVIKNNIDYLVIGYFFDLKTLGLYFFAYNAGLGISSTIIHSASNSLLPHLCNQSQQSLKKEFLYTCGWFLTIIIALVLLQISLVDIYIPLIFGERWVSHGAIPIITVLLLSAIPRALIESINQLMRSRGHLDTELKFQFVMASLITLVLLLNTESNLLTIASAVTVTIYGLAIIYFSFVYYSIFPKLLDSQTTKSAHNLAATKTR